MEIFLLTSISVLGFIGLWDSFGFSNAILIAFVLFFGFFIIRFFLKTPQRYDQTTRNNLYILVIILTGFIIILLLGKLFFSLKLNYWTILMASNIVGFCTMTFDKYQALSNRWRIPDNYFFAIGIFSAGIALIIASIMYSHKNWKDYFLLRNFALLGIHCVGIMFCYFTLAK